MPRPRRLCLCTRGAGKSWPLSSLPSRGLLGEHVVEPGVAELHAVGHASGDGAVARFLRRELHGADERGDAVLLTEVQRNDAWIARGHGAAHIARIIILFVRELRG